MSEQTTDLPDYVFHGGQQVFPPPLVLQDTRLKSFLLAADLQAQQAILDRQLNLPWNSAMHYRAVSPYLQLAVAQAGHAYSADPDERGKGWMTETDVAYWLLVECRPQEGGKPYLAWFLPYVFVDSAIAVTSGREIYGFAKELGVFNFREKPFCGTTETLAVTHFSKDAKRQTLPVIEVQAPPEAGQHRHLGSEVQQLVEGLHNSLKQASHPLHQGWELLLEALRTLWSGEVPMIFLKQIPDAEIPGKACYQAVVETCASVTAFQGGGLLPAGYRIWSANYDSHPIASDLGLQPWSDAALSLYVDFSFQVGNGRVIARA